MGAVKIFLFAVVCIYYAIAEDVVPVAEEVVSSAEEVVAEKIHPVETTKRVVCYFNNVAKYRPDMGKFVVDNIPDLCTHLVYSYARLDDDLQVVFSDPEGDEVSYKRFVGLREKYPKTKFLISLAKKNGHYWYEVANDVEASHKLQKNIVEFTRTHGFDGFEFDVHLFAFGKDQENFKEELYHNFCRDMRALIEEEAKTSGKEKLLYSLVLPELFNFEFNVGFFIDFVDWVVVTEHLRDLSEIPRLFHMSSLYSKDDVSINATVHYYLNHGATPEKITMALAFFGNSYKTKDGKTDLFSEASGIGFPGKYTSVPGRLAYFEICSLLKENRDFVLEKEAIDGFIYNGPIAFRGDDWLSFDDVEMVKYKATYALDMHLGGLAILSLDFDDFHNFCGAGEFPLTKAAVETFLKV